MGYKSLLFTNECRSDCLKNNIKIYIKIAPTCFGAVTPSSGSSGVVYSRTVRHTYNELPEDGVTAPKHVGAILF